MVHHAVRKPSCADDSALLALVSPLPNGDWRIGTPFYFCAVLQLVSLLLALWHFRKHRARGAG